MRCAPNCGQGREMEDDMGADDGHWAELMVRLGRGFMMRWSCQDDLRGGKTEQTSGLLTLTDILVY